MVQHLADHPLRAALADEIHNRPHPELRAPQRISHLALVTGEAAAEAERGHIAELCRRHGAPPPPAGAAHWAVRLGELELRWERHTEFSTYSFIQGGPFETPFARNAVDLVPADWLAGLGGAVHAACHVAFEPRDAPERDADALAVLFEGQRIVGSRVMGGALVWTDFRVHGDGYDRFLVRDDGLDPSRAGRLVQRLLELDTYRMMALLALPVAREAAPAISRMEGELADIVAAARGRGGPGGGDGRTDDRRLLDDLSRLAAEVERMVAAGAYRFGAARAYGEIVASRLDALSDERIGGFQRVGQFLKRRFEPAMRTCRSVEGRLDSLSRRIARTADLLRTRVNVQLEAQNQALLASMDHRAKLQLRLQETVEGLSVVAISYYSVGLVGYVVKGLDDAGLPLAGGAVLALATPVVVGLVWVALRRLRRRLGDPSR